MTFFALLNFMGGTEPPPKVVPKFLTRPRGTSHDKVSGVPPLSPKITEAHMLNFKPIFDPVCKKYWGTLVPGGVYASKPWSLSSTCKHFKAQRHLAAEIWFPKSGFGE